jgi:hypothetical protein
VSHDHLPRPNDILPVRRTAYVGTGIHVDVVCVVYGWFGLATTQQMVSNILNRRFQICKIFIYSYTDLKASIIKFGYIFRRQHVWKCLLTLVNHFDIRHLVLFRHFDGALRPTSWAGVTASTTITGIGALSKINLVDRCSSHNWFCLLLCWIDTAICGVYACNTSSWSANSFIISLVHAQYQMSPFIEEGQVETRSFKPIQVRSCFVCGRIMIDRRNALVK